MRRRRRLGVTCFLLALASTACGGSGTGVDPVPDPALEPFVGTWDAEVFTVTSVADTSIVADLIEIDGTFILNIQPSGQYTAQLSFVAVDSLGVAPFVEIGQLSVAGSFLTLRPNGGQPATSSYTFVSPTYLRLEGPTEFDFNLDGDADPATALIELRRR